MAEYIERSDAKEELLSWARCIKHPEHLMTEDAMCVLDGIPAADVVEVPCHCKDCRYNDPSWQLSADSIGCRYWGIYPDPDDWCCKAERKGGE